MGSSPFEKRFEADVKLVTGFRATAPVAVYTEIQKRCITLSAILYEQHFSVVLLYNETQCAITSAPSML